MSSASPLRLVAPSNVLAGTPGVVGIDDRRLHDRVPLVNDDEYHEAVLAHDQERVITVTGELSREGNLNWIYNAELVHRPHLPNNSGTRQEQGRLDFPPGPLAAGNRY